MFEILKALLGVRAAAGPRMTYYVGGGGSTGHVLRIEIPITEDEAQFVKDMEAMFAPVEES